MTKTFTLYAHRLNNLGHTGEGVKAKNKNRLTRAHIRARESPLAAPALYRFENITSNTSRTHKKKAHPTFGVMRQSCGAYSPSRKYLSSKTIGHSPHHLYLMVDPLHFPGRYGAVVPRRNTGSISPDCDGPGQRISASDNPSHHLHTYTCSGGLSSAELPFCHRSEGR